jgi:hypothetical protein
MKLLQLFLLTALLASTTTIVDMVRAHPKTAEQKALDARLSKEKRGLLPPLPPHP